MPLPVPSAPGQGHGRPPRRGPFRRVRDGLVLSLHRLADRLEWLPPEFGAEAPVADDDAPAVVAEWIRCARHWASYNPEEVFALKVGAVMLIGAVLAFWLAISLFL